MMMSRAQNIGYGWFSPSMAKAAGRELLYLTPTSTTVRVTLVDSWPGGRRLAGWRDLKYVGRVLLDSCVGREVQA